MRPSLSPHLRCSKSPGNSYLLFSWVVIVFPVNTYHYLKYEHFTKLYLFCSSLPIKCKLHEGQDSSLFLTLLGIAILRLVCGPLRITQTLSGEAQDQNYFRNYTENLVAFLTTSAKSVVGKTAGLQHPTTQGHQTVLVVTVFFTTTRAHDLKTKALSFKNTLDEAV